MYLLPTPNTQSISASGAIARNVSCTLEVRACVEDGAVLQWRDACMHGSGADTLYTERECTVISMHAGG